MAWVNKKAFANTCSAQQHRKLHHAAGREGNLRCPASTHRADASFYDWAFFSFAGRTSNCAEADQRCFCGQELSTFWLAECNEEACIFLAVTFDDANIGGVQGRGASASVDLNGNLFDAEIGQRNPFLPAQDGQGLFGSLLPRFWRCCGHSVYCKLKSVFGHASGRIGATNECQFICEATSSRRMKKPHFRVPLITCRGCLEVGLLNGAGENRTPVPKQSTFHVYASSQVFNLDVVEVHLTNDNTSWQTKFLIPPGLASPLEPARILHTALYQASRTMCRRLSCECVVSVAN